MNVVSVACPIPLVIRVVKRAKELGAFEEIWPYGQSNPHRHMMQFVFLDVENGDIFFHESGRWIWDWAGENEPD